MAPGKIVDIKREEIHPFAVLGEELRDRTVVAEWRDDLNLGITNRQERIANTKRRNFTRWFTRETKVLLIGCHCSFEIFHSNDHMIKPFGREPTVTRFAKKRGVLAMIDRLRVLDQRTTTCLRMKKRNNSSQALGVASGR